MISPEWERARDTGSQLIWRPQQGPQVALMMSEADEILYGGAAGGGKTDASIGYSLTKARRALIMRRQFPQLYAINERLTNLVGRDNFMAGDQVWTYNDPFGIQHKIELGSAPNIGDEAKQQGRPHDTLILDEAAHFEASQVDFLTGWLRDTDGSTCRLICASNPPLDGTGVWMIDRWRPWLDPNYPNPAVSGEERTFIRGAGDRWEEVQKGHPDGTTRTFISAKLKDNKFLGDAYRKRLMALPEHLRNALLNGDFLSGAVDRPLAVIPASSIKAAQDRWDPDGSNKYPITHIGVDPSRGGDRTVIVLRHRHHVARPVILPKEHCRTGGQVAARVLDLLGDNLNAVVRVDAIGIGASVLDHLAAYLPAWQLEGIVASGGAPKDAPDDRLGYANRRAYDYWQLRLRLNVETSMLELPPDPIMYSELSTPNYTTNARGILVESKESIIKRIGRSPDIGDATVLACTT